MDIRPVLHILGFLVVGLGMAMLLPVAVDLVYEQSVWDGFVMAAGATIFLGASLLATTAGEKPPMRARHAFLLTALAWVTLSFVGALPLAFAGIGLTPVDALFESVSGLTTTGATVMSGLENQPRAVLIWRALLQWIGGIGVIVMAVAIFPFLGVGGMALFRTESSDRSEKVLPRAREIAAGIFGVYVTFSLACMVAYWMAGMSGFDAIAHAMTTVSTAGYSTYDGSVGAFSEPAIHWVATVFMILGALPFVLYVQAMARGRLTAITANPQVLAFLGFLVSVIVVMALWLMAVREIGVLDAFRLAAFNVTSVVTTTGYATADYGAWGNFPLILFFMLMFAGGCTGSTAGSIKIYRHQVAAIVFAGQLRRLVLPNAVVITQYDDKPITADIVASITAYLTVAFASIIVLAALLGLLGLDFLTSISGAVTAIMNVGPGLGPVIGPAGNFSSLPEVAKLLIAFGMLLGRLEFFTLLILLVPSFWRH